MDMLSDIEKKYLSWRIEGSDIANINENASENEPVMPSKWTYGYLENVLDLARKSSGAFDPNKKHGHYSLFPLQYLLCSRY